MRGIHIGKITGRKLIVFTIAICTFVLIAALVAVTSHANQSVAGFGGIQGYLDTDKQTILYFINLEDGVSPVIMVASREPKTPDDLRYYAQTSQTRGEALLQSGVNNLYVWVTFRRVLSIEEFKDFVAQYGLDVKHYTIRAYGEKGDRITIEGGPQDGVIVPAMYDRVIESVQVHENGKAQIGGVFDVKALVQSSAYRKLLVDSRVFIVDVTATLAYQELVSRKITSMTWAEYANRVQLGMTYGPFWNMEKLGLDKFASQ